MRLLNTISTLFRSVLFNFKYMPLKQAVKLPVYVMGPLDEVDLSRGQIRFADKPRRAQVIIGGGKSTGLQAFGNSIIAASGAEIVFEGNAIITQGTTLRCDENSTIKFGGNFYCNANCFLRSTNSLSFGNDCLLGWNVVVNTTDGHQVWRDGVKLKTEAPIVIGNHVWLAANVKVGKGVELADDCVVAQSSVVVKSCDKAFSLLGGIPAKVIFGNISWRK